MTKLFAAYLRTSTDDNQTPEDSRRWQLALAEQLIAPVGGQIVASCQPVRPLVAAARGDPAPRRCGGPVPRLGRTRHRRAPTCVFRRAVPARLPCSEPPRPRAVGPGGRRPGRSRQRSPRPRHEPLRRSLEGRAPTHPGAHPRLNPRLGYRRPLAWRTSELRLPPRQHRATPSEPVEGGRRHTAPHTRARP